MRSYPGGVRHDYKDSGHAKRASRFSAVALSRLALRAIDPRSLNPRGLSWFAAGLVLPIVGVTLLLVSEPNESMVPSEPASVQTAAMALPDSPVGPSVRREIALLPPSGESIRLALPPLARPGSLGGKLPRPEDLARSALLEQGQALTLRVKRGDSLDLMFRRNELSITDLGVMMRLPEAGRYLAKINPGDKFEIIHDGERVLSLSREISESKGLWIKRNGEAFVAELIDLATETRTAGAHGVIKSSLWNAAIESGLDQALISDLAGIFAWDIDFLLDVREGDNFTVVYEEIWRDGVKLRNGEIIAAEYVNQGDMYRAARYVDATGHADYFTPEGMNVRRPFLRAPLDYVRVSSNFNPSRKHPILNTIRAHRGTDYAAPKGTPVQAAGDGKIIARGEYGSYGNRVEIQHGGNITTLYAHLSAFGKYRNGDRVKQGDIIGYVGMTGSATGPHLHYEYRVNGVHQNPRTVELPESEPIAREYLDDFRQTTATLWHQLDLYEGALLASNDD